MTIKRSSALAIILMAFVLGFGQMAPAQAAGNSKNVTTQTTYAVDETVFDSTTGEAIHFAGDVRVLAHTKFLSDGTVRVSIQCNATVPGVGQTSGKSYHAKVHTSNTFTFSAAGFPFTVSLTCDMRIANPGSCNDIEVPQTVQFTVWKNGSVSAQYVEDDGGDTWPYGS